MNIFTINEKLIDWKINDFFIVATKQLGVNIKIPQYWRK